MFKRIKQDSFEHVDCNQHPDFETANTSVSEYFRKFSGGRSALLPQDPRPEVSDQRTESEMIDDNSRLNHMGCDDLDVMREMSENRERFEKAINEVELAPKQAEAFRQATQTLDDPNASDDAKREAMEVLEELNEKITRARKH